MGLLKLSVHERIGNSRLYERVYVRQYGADKNMQNELADTGHGLG